MTTIKKLLSVSVDAKTVKGEKAGYLTGILYLSPAKISGYEVCPQRSAGCTAACLNTAGRAGVFKTIAASRLAKTKWYFEDRPAFMARLVKDVAALIRKAAREGLTPVVRLNGTSDIPWERVRIGDAAADARFGAKNAQINRMSLQNMTIMQAFPDVQFYDYTKITKRALAHARGDMPANYHLTFSLTEENDAAALDVLLEGGSVAAVLKTVDGALPSWLANIGGRFIPSDVSYLGYKVVNGDETDLRFKDASGVIVGLKAKGKARGDTSGFVR